MKRILKKILTILLIVICIGQFCMSAGINIGMSSISYAEETVDKKEVMDTISGAITGILGGIVGILTYPYRLYGLIAGVALQTLGGAVAGVANGLATVVVPFTPDSIFFNKYYITTIDFFNNSVTSSASGDILTSIRDNIALWYYVMMIIACAALLSILLYVGIRMAISTVASDKAMYKKMLIDWATSLALLFLLHFIIIATIKVNNVLVEVMQKASKPESGTLLDNTAVQLLLSALSPNIIVGFGSLILYIALQIETFIFLLMYMKRMFTVAFLIIIAPLITITYSIDKMGDQKSQALNAWLKEFMFNVLIQPFHCILYLAFGNIAVSLVTGGGFSIESFLGFDNGGLGGFILAIVALKFILDGEKIVKKIFGFDKASSLGNAMASAALIANAAKKASSVAGKAGDMKKYVNMGGLRSKIPDNKLGNKANNFLNKMDKNKEKRRDNKINKMAEKMGVDKDTAKEKYENKQAKKQERLQKGADFLGSDAFKKGVAGSTAGLTALATYLAGDDAADFLTPGLVGKGVYDSTKQKVGNWQKRKTSSYEAESVDNFKAYAKMTHKNGDLTTEEGMNNYRKYVNENYNAGKYGNEFSDKRNAQAGKDLKDAFEGKLDPADLATLKSELAMELSDKFAGQFDPERLYRDLNIAGKTTAESGAAMSFEEFEKAIEPYVIQQLGSNMYGYTEQFDSIMQGKGIDHETAIQNVENNRERFNTVTTVNNDPVIQTIGEKEIKKALEGIDIEADESSIDGVITKLEKQINQAMTNLETKIGSDKAGDIFEKVQAEISKAARDGREVDISSIGHTKNTKEYAKTVLQQHYITEKKEVIEKYIKDTSKS